MVEDLNSQQLAGGDQLLGCIQVFPAWVGRSSRVVVSDDNAISIAKYSGLKHLSWVNKACRDGSMTHHVIPRHLIFGIKMQGNEMFFPVMWRAT